MRVTNKTKLPAAELRVLLAFAARGTNTTGVAVHVGVSGRYLHGRAWDGRIALYLPRTTTAPGWPKEWRSRHAAKRLRRMYPTIPTERWQDVVVYLAAHEFRHVRQFRLYLAGKRRRRSSEHDAIKHGIKRLSAYRVATGRTPIVPIKQPNPFAKVPV